MSKIRKSIFADNSTKVAKEYRQILRMDFQMENLYFLLEIQDVRIIYSFSFSWMLLISEINKREIFMNEYWLHDTFGHTRQVCLCEHVSVDGCSPSLNDSTHKFGLQWQANFLSYMLQPLQNANIIIFWVINFSACWVWVCASKRRHFEES